MLGRCSGVLRQYRAQWRLSARGLSFVSESKCSKAQAGTKLIGHPWIFREQNGAPKVPGNGFFLGGVGVISRALHAQAVDDSYLDQHFIEHEMQYPLIQMPKADKKLEAGFRWIWEKAAETNYKQIVPAVKAWVDEGNVLTKELVDKLIIRLYSRMLYFEGHRLTTWLAVEKPFELTETDHLIRLDLAVREGKESKARTTFNQVTEKTEMAYVMFLQLFANRNRHREAEKLMEKMKALTLITTPLPYSLMIGMYLRLGQVDKAKEMYSELEASGIAPDAFTYQSMMRFKEKLSVEGFEEKVEQMLSHAEAKPRGPKWKNMIRLYAELGKSADVERLWRDVKAEPCVPEGYYLGAADAFGTLGEIEKFEKVCKELESQNHGLSARQCFLMIQIYSKNGLMSEAESLAKRMSDLGYKLGFTVYHHLVCGYMNKRQFDKALEKFQESLEKGGSRGFNNPLYFTVLVVMDAYAEKQDVKGAEELIAKFTGNYPLDIRVYNALLKVYLRAKKPVYDMEDRMKIAKVQPNDETTRLLKKLRGLT